MIATKVRNMLPQFSVLSSASNIKEMIWNQRIWDAIIDLCDWHCNITDYIVPDYNLSFFLIMKKKFFVFTLPYCSVCVCLFVCLLSLQLISVLCVCCISLSGWSSFSMWHCELWCAEWVWPCPGLALWLCFTQQQHHETWLCCGVREHFLRTCFNTFVFFICLCYFFKPFSDPNLSPSIITPLPPPSLPSSLFFPPLPLLFFLFSILYSSPFLFSPLSSGSSLLLIFFQCLFHLV